MLDIYGLDTDFECEDAERLASHDVVTEVGQLLVVDGVITGSSFESDADPNESTRKLLKRLTGTGTPPELSQRQAANFLCGLFVEYPVILRDRAINKPHTWEERLPVLFMTLGDLRPPVIAGVMRIGEPQVQHHRKGFAKQLHKNGYPKAVLARLLEDIVQDGNEFEPLSPTLRNFYIAFANGDTAASPEDHIPSQEATPPIPPVTKQSARVAKLQQMAFEKSSRALLKNGDAEEAQLAIKTIRGRLTEQCPEPPEKGTTQANTLDWVQWKTLALLTAFPNGPKPMPLHEVDLRLGDEYDMRRLQAEEVVEAALAILFDDSNTSAN